MADQGKRSLVAGTSKGPVVGNSDDRLIPSANLKGEILVPYRSPQQHLTETPTTHSLKKNDEAPSPELPEICYNKKDATVKYVVPCRCFQFAGKIHLIMIQAVVQVRTDPGFVSTVVGR